MHRYHYVFTELRYVLWKSYLFQDNSFILKPHIAPNWFLGSQLETSSDRPRIRFQIGANHSQMIPILLPMVLDTLIWRHHGSQNVYKSFPGRPIYNLIILGENSFYLEATLPHVGDQNAYSTNVMYHSEL